MGKLDEILMELNSKSSITGLTNDVIRIQHIEEAKAAIKQLFLACLPERLNDQFEPADRLDEEALAHAEGFNEAIDTVAKNMEVL